MSDVLFLNQPSVGHLNTLLSMALQMREDGHQVRFLVPGWRGFKTSIQILDTAFKIPQIVRGHGIEIDLFSPPLSAVWHSLFLPLKTGYAELLHAVDLMSRGLGASTRRIVRVLEQKRPDAMVVDFSLLGACLAAEIVGIPYAMVYHSGLPFRGPGIPPFGSGLPIGADEAATRPFELREERLLATLMGRVNAVRARWQLPIQQEDMLRRPASPWLNLVTSVSAAEAPRDNLTANTMFIGPCFGKRTASAGFPFDKLAPDRFKVYVSLGTVFNNKPQVFRKILQALDALAYQVVVSAGVAYETLQKEPVPANALLFKSVPQVELLPRIDLFLSHGGNNSINEALAAGKPIVVLPIGGEQGDNASRITYLGVGRQVNTATFTAEQLLAVVEEVRGDAAFRERAVGISRTIAATQGAVTASRCVTRMARTRKPLVRPDGLGPTIRPDDVERLVAGATVERKGRLD